ncbi:hypothetical protein [Anoxybacillus sp. TBDG-1]
MINSLILLLTLLSFCYGIINYKLSEIFIKQTEITSLDKISQLHYAIVAIFDETSCINCINAFRKLKSRIDVPIYFLKMDVAKKFVAIDCNPPVLLIFHQGNAIAKICSQTIDKVASHSTYIRLIMEELKAHDFN